MDLLSIIVITLFLSLFINLFLKKLHISPIVGYIFTGVIIVTFMKFVHINSELLSHIAEFGIVFLMFTIGLEFSVNHLKKMKNEVFVFGTLEVVITTFCFSVISFYLFSLDLKTSIVIGSALSLSSTAIVLKVLNENGDIHRPYGRYSTGILIFQDLAVIPILLMLTIISDPNASISDMLLNTLYSAIAVGVIIFILGKYVTEKFLAYVVDTHIEELFISAILLIVLSSSLLAHIFGFSYSLGAFLAGMLIAETKYKYQIEADLVPFRDILLGIFFITVGLQVNIDTILNNFFLIIGLAIGILAIKAILIFAILKVFTFTKRAFKVALAIAQVGEFSFAIFALASANHLLDHTINEILIAVVIISLIFTSLVLRYVRIFVQLFYKDKTEILDEPLVSSTISNHIIVCGYSLLGQKIVKYLKQSNFPYVAIEHDREHVKLGHQRSDIVFFGNAASKIMLNNLQIKNAASVIIAIDNDDKVRLICQSIRDINPNISIIIKVTHQAQIDDLRDIKVEKFINENEIIAEQLVKKATQCSL